MKKIKDGCGGNMGLDQESFSASVLRWARILVRVNGRRLLKTVEVEDGSYNFSLHLWWEIPPCVGKLQEARVSLRSSSLEVRGEVCGASRATKKVVGGGGQSRQIVDKESRTEKV